MPNVLLEAQTLKKFIISTKCPTGPKEILLNGKGGILFKVGSYVELAQKEKGLLALRIKSEVIFIFIQIDETSSIAS